MENNLTNVKDYYIEFEGIRELREALEALREYTKAIDFDKAFKYNEQHFRRFVEQTGFMIPMQWQPWEVHEFPISNREDGEKILLDYYKADNSANLNIIFDDIKDFINKNHMKWNSLITDCLVCYENNLFKPIVPSLISVIEGIITESNDINNGYKNKINEYCKKQGMDSSFTRIIWTSIAVYFDNLYRFKKFNEERAPFLNRHWIQHGRDNSALWREIDVIQLFCALHTIMTLRYGREI